MIHDPAFTSGNYEWVSAEAQNDYQTVQIDQSNIAQLFTDASTSGDPALKITDARPMDKLVLKYRVPVDQCDLVNNAGQPITDRNHPADGIKAVNTVHVGDDEPTDAQVTNIPGVAGKTNVTVQKNWQNGGNTKTEQTSAKLKLYYRIDNGDGTFSEWAPYTAYDSTYATPEKTVYAKNTNTSVVFEDLPVYHVEANGTRKSIYYKVEEEVIVSDGSANLYTGSGVPEDGVKASRSPSMALTNTWEGVNVEGIKLWRDDEGVSNRPAARLQLQQKVNNGWQNIGDPVNVGNSDRGYHMWESLPKYEAGTRNLIEYRVIEVDTDSRYTPEYNGNTVTNVYNKMTVTAEKNWLGVDSDLDKPDSVTFQLYRTTDPSKDISQWDECENPITIQKADYSRSGELLKWTELDKTDESGNAYYYRVVEISTVPADKLEEFAVSYNGYNAANNSQSGRSGKITVNNTWRKTNVTVTKEWLGDRGYEDMRPPITFQLEISRDGGSTWSAAPVSDAAVTLYNKGDGNFAAEGSTETNQYTWHALDAGPNVKYRVIEQPVVIAEDDDSHHKLQRGTKIYDTYYGYDSNTEPIVVASDDPNHPGVKILNKSDMITIRVDKNWVGVYGEDIPDRVTFRLEASTDQEHWTKFSDKVATKNNGQFPTTNWTWMSKTDPDGNPYYYRVREILVERDTGQTQTITDTYVDENGQTVTVTEEIPIYEEVLAEFTPEVQSTENGAGDLSYTVTNTWNLMNVSVQKAWEDGSHSENYTSVTMQLMQKVTEDGTWEAVADRDPVHVTSANGWKLDNAWKNLPRTNAAGETIYYRAVEIAAVTAGGETINIADSPDFYTVPDGAGIKATGTSVVTNVPKHIGIQVSKSWDLIGIATQPTTYTVTLMASLNGGLSWQKASELTQILELNGIAAEKTVNKDETTEWNNLPTKYDDNGTTRDIVYRVIEGSMAGFSPSYTLNGNAVEPDEMNITKNSNLAILNAENAPYTKRPAKPESSLNTIVTIEDNYVGPNTVVLNSGTIIDRTKDGILQNGTLSADDLANVDTAMVNIDGQEVECYLFKWRIDLLQNQQENGHREYVLTDTLTDGSVFYNDVTKHGVVLVGNRYNNKAWFDFDQEYAKQYVGLLRDNQVSDYNDWLKVVYDNNMTTATFTINENIIYITYYTATPKKTVDNMLAETGEFRLTNYIQDSNESKPSSADLIVNGGDETGYIDKINSTANGTQNGYGKMTDGVAHYTLDVNQYGKYLSSGSTFNVTDKFHMLSFQPADGEEQIGPDITLVPHLKNVVVMTYDNEGHMSLLDADKYSYSIEKNPAGEYSAVEDYSDRFDNTFLQTHGGGVEIKTLNYDMPKGLVVELNYHGHPNTEVSYSNEMFNAQHGVGISLGSDHYDSSGNLVVTLTFNQDVAAGTNLGLLNLTNFVQNPMCSVKSAKLVEKVPATEYITKFTLPDGARYRITYDYEILDQDGNKIPNNTTVKAGSKLTLHNEAEVETSNGEKRDESTKTTYNIQKSGAYTYIDEGFEIIKADIGNKSLTDLNAEFMFAKFDEETQTWVYAEEFPFKVDEYGDVSDVEHDAVYGSKTDADGTIPAAGTMVLDGSFHIGLQKNTLYKLIEVKVPDNHSDCYYSPVPYQNGERTVAANADNTYYFVFDTADEKLTELKTAAGLTATEVRSVSLNDSSLTVYNTRMIDIGARKIWEQDPDSAVNDVQVAVQLMRSESKDMKNAELVNNQISYIDEADRTNYDLIKNAYILNKRNGKWEQEAIWKNLPNGVEEDGTAKPYFYFVREAGYKIGENWYWLDPEDGHYYATIGNEKQVFQDAQGNSAEYRPSYADDATSGTGVVQITNSRKLLVKKQWRDINGNPLNTADIPASEITFTLYGITSNGTQIPISLPAGSDKLTAPSWEIEVPRDLLSSEFVRFRIVENTQLDEFIVSDVYALNGSVGVIYLINKDTNPTSVDVQVEKSWGDGNELHTTDDKVEVTLYQYTGSKTVDDTFIRNFIANGSTGAGISVVKGITNPVTLGTADEETGVISWQAEWKGLPFKDGNKKIQYFVTEKQSDTTKDIYQATYDFDGNAKYSAVRTLTVTNREPGSLVIKKQWRDKTLTDNPIIPDPAYDYQIKLKLYRKALEDVQPENTEAATIRERYGLTDADVVVGLTDPNGLEQDGTITLSKDNHWTISLKNLPAEYQYYIEEIDGEGYELSEESGFAAAYGNEGQQPGSDRIMTVDNLVEGARISITGKKQWVFPSGMEQQYPTSITLTLEQYAGAVSGTPEETYVKYVTLADADEDGNWIATWENLPASKNYRIVEKPLTGWTTGYENNLITGSDGTVNIINTLDTGELQVEKKWLSNETGGTQHVDVELWRQAYDANGNPVTAAAEPGNTATQNSTSPFAAKSRLFSIARVRRALEASEETTENPEVVEETPVSRPAVKPFMSGVAVKATGQNEYLIEGVNFDTVKDVSGICGDTLIDSIEVVFNKSVSGGGSLEINGQTETGISPSGSTWSYTFAEPKVISSVKVLKWGITWDAQLSYIKLYYTPQGPQVSITNKPANTSVIAGDTTKLEATTTEGDISWSSEPSGVASVDADGNVTFLQVSEETQVTITASATGSGVTNSDSVTFTVNPFRITNKPANTEVTEGDELPALQANADADWSSSDENIAVVDNGSITFTSYGTVTITAKHGDVTDSVTFQVKGRAFEAEPDYNPIHEGMTATITGADNVTWSLKNPDDDGKVSINGNKITANCSNDDVELVGTRGGTEVELTLHIRPLQVPLEGEGVTPENYKMNVNSTLPILNIVGDVTVASSDESIAWYDPAEKAIITGEKTGGPVTITVQDAGQALSFTLQVKADEAKANIPQSAEKVQVIRIDAGANWLSDRISNLPRTDGRGNTYRYFLKEQSTEAYIPVAYSTNTVGAELTGSTARLNLTNATKQTETEVELPETGFGGTKIYYAAGGIVLLLSLVGFAAVKRRRWLDE
ncbi:MAG: Cna B-type domain-containing protein [Oscillospiraceae bacterium]|nr:Cna B-type domain-containing protein [Oscillospiraceae bacterium]